MTFIKARLKGQSDWSYVTPEDSLTTSPRLAATFSPDAASEFLDRVPRDFPDWETEIEEWRVSEWLDYHA